MRAASAAICELKAGFVLPVAWRLQAEAHLAWRLRLLWQRVLYLTQQAGPQRSLLHASGRKTLYA
jgi:hypothetical protein